MTPGEQSPAVVADDLRALAEQVPFERSTIAVLERAAELLDPEGQAVTARPSYDEIAEAICSVLEVGDYELVLLQSGQAVDNPEWRLAKALEKAGLIDAKGVRR